MDKVEALKEGQNIEKYKGFWGVDGIQIMNLGTGETTDIIQANTGTGVSNFVALCRKEKTAEFIADKCDIGRIIVTYGSD